MLILNLTYFVHAFNLRNKWINCMPLQKAYISFHYYFIFNGASGTCSRTKRRQVFCPISSDFSFLFKLRYTCLYKYLFEILLLYRRSEIKRSETVDLYISHQPSNAVEKIFTIELILRSTMDEKLFKETDAVH